MALLGFTMGNHASMSTKNMRNDVMTFLNKLFQEQNRKLVIIMDTSNETLVAVGSQRPAVFFVSDAMMDTRCIMDVSLDTFDAINLANPHSFPEWTWNDTKRVFKKTNPAIITDDMRTRAILATKKIEVFSRVVRKISKLRRKVETGFPFQNVIYEQKERQAQLLVDTDFSEQSIARAPYVVQYADISGIPVKQAATEILFQAKLSLEHLRNTERIRLVMLKRIKFARTIEEVNSVFGATQSGTESL